VGYAGNFISKNETKIATLDIGYADGLNRLLSNKIFVYHKLEEFPLIGNISMDLSTIDIGKTSIKILDKVNFFSNAEDRLEGMRTMCKLIPTIPYELLTVLGKRVKRNYI
jgi:alanine racemase